MLTQAIDLYRAPFQPSAQLAQPYVMLGVNVFAADTDAEAQLLFTSLQQAFVQPAPRPAGPAAAAGATAIERQLGPQERAHAGRGARRARSSARRRPCGAGSQAFIARTGADELMITSQIFDHAARLRSYELTASVRDA